MKLMEIYAKQYQHEHRNEGTVSDITDYSFKFTSHPKKKDEQPKSYIVMISYFYDSLRDKNLRGNNLIWGDENKEEATCFVYSDWLYYKDLEKYNKCCEEVWNNNGWSFDSRKPEDIEKFLSLYLGKNILLISIYQYTNQSNGFPYWRFDYKTI